MTNALEITAGNDEEIEITLTQRDDDTDVEIPVNITGYTFFFTVKETGVESTDANDDDALVRVTWTDHVDQVNGITVLLIPHASTASLQAGEYWCGIKYKTAGGFIKDLEFGTDVLRVRRQVTNRTS